MSLTELFKSLVLDTWYKALVYLGGLVLVLSLFIEVRGISNYQVQMISLGIFLFGLGEWKNHKFISTIKPPNVYTGPAMHMRIPVWKPDLIGIIFDLAGFSLIFLGIRSIVLSI